MLILGRTYGLKENAEKPELTDILGENVLLTVPIGVNVSLTYKKPVVRVLEESKLKLAVTAPSVSKVIPADKLNIPDIKTGIVIEPIGTQIHVLKTGTRSIIFN